MTDHTLPRQVLVEEWCLLLSVEEAEESQNFFALGGDSLVAMELAVRFHDRTGQDFPIEELFVDGNFGALVAVLSTPEERGSCDS